MPIPHHQKHRAVVRRASILFTVLLMAAGCAPIEVRESRQVEAVLAASRGEPPEELARRLAAQGYRCTPASGAAAGKQEALQCASQKGNLWPPYSCVFRIELKVEGAAGSGGASPSLSHACAGL